MKIHMYIHRINNDNCKIEEDEFIYYLKYIKNHLSVALIGYTRKPINNNFKDLYFFIVEIYEIFHSLG